MIRRQEGFTLVELMVTMVIFVIVIVTASGIFTGLLTQFKQQSKIAETNTEGIVGLELLRQDIENAGYGLPWSGLNAYTESAANPFNTNDAPANAPRAVTGANNIAGIFVGGTDYLVIKSLNVLRTDPTVNSSEKWTRIFQSAAYDSLNPRVWNKLDGTQDDTQTFSATDRVIVLQGTTGKVERALITSGASFHTTYSSIKSDPWQPQETDELRIVYGINGAADPIPVRPFNRADYFVQTPAVMPGRCAVGTGILYKAMMNHDGGGSYSLLPLLDCVADMQVIYRLDMDDDEKGDVGTVSDVSSANGGAATSSEGATIATVQATLNDAALLRQRLREVRVYILAHEGQRDPNYRYPNPTVTVGEFGLGRVYNFAAGGIGNWQEYRWKVYTLVVKPRNLRGDK